MLNIFRLFIVKSVRILKDDGVFCQIFPLAFAADVSAADLRIYILQSLKLLMVEAFPERDDPKRRVFEAAKMSVCITLLRKTCDTQCKFSVRINTDRYVDDAREPTVLSSGTIALFDPKNFTIPLMTQADVDVIRKVYDRSVRLSSIAHCYTGEIDMTLGKKYFTTDSRHAILLKGAIIDRYLTRSKMSQGEIVYLDAQRYLKDNSGGRASHHNATRIVMQGITGINESVRLKMTLAQNVFCANSVNYLIIREPHVNERFLLGFLNSRLANYVFKKFSTNSNVNGYEVDNLPFPQEIPPKSDQRCIALVNRILGEKHRDANADTTAMEREIDRLVYSLYDLTPEEIETIEKNRA